MLLGAVRAACPTWIVRAKRAEKQCLDAGKFIRKKRSLWSDIKTVLATIQRHKCAYCEAPLSSRSGSGVEYDVEHYRPKAAVERWPAPFHLPFDTGGASQSGYYSLAYCLRNYLASCKSCNSDEKANYFPVKNRRSRSKKTDAAAFGREGPMLPCPLDPADIDPLKLVSFDGVTATASAARGLTHWRGVITISILGLNRQDLLTRRAEKVRDVWLAYHGSLHGVPHANAALASAVSPDSLYSSCGRSFIDLCKRDALKADLRFRQAMALLGHRV